MHYFYILCIQLTKKWIYYLPIYNTKSRCCLLTAGNTTPHGTSAVRVASHTSRLLLLQSLWCAADQCGGCVGTTCDVSSSACAGCFLDSPSNAGYGCASQGGQGSGACWPNDTTTQIGPGVCGGCTRWPTKTGGAILYGCTPDETCYMKSGNTTYFGPGSCVEIP